MTYTTATPAMAEEMQNVLRTTILQIYPKYYPKEVVEFFCQIHNREHILENIASGNMGVLLEDKTIVGTGRFECNHIKGVYVLPCFQRKGYGSHILDCLEKEIAKHFPTAILDASLPAVFFYEQRGYKTVGHGVCELENEVRLVYEIMEKNIWYKT